MQIYSLYSHEQQELKKFLEENQMYGHIGSNPLCLSFYFIKKKDRCYTQFKIITP